MSDERLKIAVFIDFDNIEIGVKNSLGSQFDVGAVLEVVKERGEVVTKVAYGDWTRATDYGRSMSQHAIHMVQRNLTPGGDKNGADINLALDALEMAFTHSHINAFVIVGGDSDFITLVEKLKQYDRKVFVVGGRSFTSQVMQKNCTEFMAYEDILGITSRGRQSGGRARVSNDIAAAMPLIRRAIKLLADREMTPNLGLLKSTLLQLDSSFSERAYGAGTFRDFVEKLARAGHLALKGADRSFYVELREAGEAAAATPGGPAAIPPPAGQEAAEPRALSEVPEASEGYARGRDARHGQPSDGVTGEPAVGAAETPAPEPFGPEAAAEGVPRPGPADGYRIMAQALSRPGANPRFPMYVRQFRSFMKTFDESFDERRYGFTGILDALRFGQREGLLRLDRDRRGGVRVHPGPQLLRLTAAPVEAPAADGPAPVERPQDAAGPPEAEAAAAPEAVPIEAEAPATQELLPFEAEGRPPALDVEQVPPTLPAEAASPEEAEPVAPPRIPRRKRTAPRTAPRTKKTARPPSKAKTKTARPRAKKS